MKKQAPSNYQEYLKSEHWSETKENYYAKKGYECRICTSDKKLNLHHRQYSDKEGSILNREKNFHLYGLCSSCHSLWHNLYGDKKLTLKYIMRIRRLLEMGAVKKQAFCLVTQGEAYRNILKAIKSRNKTGTVVERLSP